MEKPSRKKAVVIGAGAGGIATAARLAKAGFAVTVLEKNDFIGGRCSLLHRAGHRFDQGPSLLLLPKLFHQTFADLDTSLAAEGVALLRCTPNYAVWFADGARFEPTGDLAGMKAQIERWEGAGGFARYLRWLAEGHAHSEVSAAEVLGRNFTSVRQLLAPRFVLAGLRLHPLHSLWSRAARHFRTERLRRVFTFAAMYVGMSPFAAPATYSLLPYAELADGVWYPRGGFATVLAALRRVGERLGVEYRLGAPVRRVLMRSSLSSSSSDDDDNNGGDDDGGAGETARGVELESGEVVEADVVVVNADLVYAYSNLLPRETPRARRYAASLRARDGSCSAISFYWGLDRAVPALRTHNIFLADEYRESFDAIFARRTLPDEPSFYVHVPSRVDPTAAPPGRDSVIALVPVGHLAASKGFEREGKRNGDKGPRRDNNNDNDDDTQDWPALVARARAAVLATVEARTGCGALAPSIAHEVVNDPAAWEAKFNLDKGSILGLGHGFFDVLAFRPGTRARGFPGVYFVGASTHPGTGVPVVLAGARLTAEQILDDLRLPVPWRGRQQGPVHDHHDHHGDGDGLGRGGLPKSPLTAELDKIHVPFWESAWFATSATILSVLVLLLAIYLSPLLGGLTRHALPQECVGVQL
ncbi:putative phytoene dehydrogenase [Rosellinia necatrix]|uniref:Phytoene desaturase n=1 Tax=Rosellinia necatrix TaxID=77044 RepID=A0A1W2TU45_ROSNE|nr:putative phytoene dehydrogenase [Rosellinia necatrix]